MKNLLAFLFFIASLLLWAQEKGEPLFYFNSTKDYLNNNLSEEGVVPIIVNQGERFIEVKKFLNPETGKWSKEGRYPWALYIDFEPYFNLRFKNIKDSKRPEFFVTADIIGRYCAIIVFKDEPNLYRNDEVYYGGGLQGILINESNNWGKNWKDRDGFKARILIVDTNNLEEDFRYAIWNILTKRNFNKILDLSLTKDEIKSMTIENIVDIIHDKNSID